MTSAQKTRQQPAMICCGQRLRALSIDGTRLMFTYCGRCDATTWFSNGRPVDRADAIEAAGAVGRSSPSAAKRA